MGKERKHGEFGEEMEPRFHPLCGVAAGGADQESSAARGALHKGQTRDSIFSVLADSDGQIRHAVATGRQEPPGKGTGRTDRTDGDAFDRRGYHGRQGS